MRPAEWLFANFNVNKNWCLIHCTHTSKPEILSLIKSKAVAGLCPTTEANLGDGLFNAVEYLRQGGIFGIGTDSNITVNPFDELRWLEYGQRLHCQNRNLLCDDLSLSTGRNLYKLATAGGAQAIGRKTGVIKVGHKADLIVVDTDQPTLFGRDDDTLLDTLIFSNIHEGVRDVYVGGIQVIKNKRHRFQNEIIKNYLSTLKALSL